MRHGSFVFKYLHATLGAALHLDFVLVQIKRVDLRHIGQQLHVQTFCNAGADLRGVAVYGLLAGEHHVHLHVFFDLLYGCSQCERGGQRIGSGEGAISHEDSLIGAK